MAGPGDDRRPVAETGLFGQRYWRNFRDDPPPTLDAWSRRHLGALVALEADIADATAGDSLLHMDLRADNILVTERGVVLVDWPCAQIGAPWLDLVCLAPSVAMQRGPLPEALSPKRLRARGPTRRAAIGRDGHCRLFHRDVTAAGGAGVANAAAVPGREKAASGTGLSRRH